MRLSVLAHQLEMTLTEEELTAEPYCQAIISGNVTVQQKTLTTFCFISLFFGGVQQKHTIFPFLRVVSFLLVCLWDGPFVYGFSVFT